MKDWCTPPIASENAMNRILFVLKTCLKDKIFLNGGRADRFEFFVFNIFAIIVFFILWIPLQLLLVSLTGENSNSGTFTQVIHILFRVVTFILFIAQYTSTLRRLHDTNRSGHHLLPILAGLLLSLGGVFLMNELLIRAGEIVAGLGLLYIIVLCCFPSTQGDNRFGAPCPSIPSIDTEQQK